MVNPELIKPFMLHEDLDVRARATSSFSDAYSDDPELLPLVLDACEKYGFAENSRYLYDTSRFVVSDATLLRVLRLLEAQDGFTAVDSLNRLIVSAPGELLKEHEAAIAANPLVDPDTLRRVRRRIEYQNWSAEQLWEEVQAFSRRSDEAASDDVDFGYAADLIRDLAPHNIPDVETICRLIREPEPKDGWLELHVFDLAGQRRLSEAVAPLVKRLHEDDDSVLEDSSAALARIGDVEAVRLIRREFPESPYHFRLYAAFLLGWLRHPEVEPTILELLESEKDGDVRLWLCGALCDQLSDRCLEVVGREIDSDPAVRKELSGVILAVATILGQDLPPEAAEWRALRDRQRASIAKFTSEDSDWDVTEPDPDGIGFLHDDEPEDRMSLDVPAPIRKTGPRVGRNDPCPCGSGKKFKKCHGKA
jgi:hypothetical protein